MQSVSAPPSRGRRTRADPGPEASGAPASPACGEEPPPTGGGRDTVADAVGTFPADAGRVHEQRVLTALRRIVRGKALYSRRLSSSYGLTAPQLMCLIAVAEEGPLTLSRLSARVFLSPSTVVGVVDRLERSGLVTRERSRTDRRQVLLAATDRGRELAAKAPPPFQDRLVHGLGRLSPEERERIAVALERVVELMEVGDVAAENEPEVSLVPDPAPPALPAGTGPSSGVAGLPAQDAPDRHAT